MNDDPKAVHVLYAKLTEVDDSSCGVLKKLTNELNNFYSKSGTVFFLTLPIFPIHR